MIDLHCHLLPGIDDGPTSLDDALAMARLAVEDGITHSICTPHIYPGLYRNTSAGIAAARAAFRHALAAHDIPLAVSYGADIHLTADLLPALIAGDYPTLANSRYFLLEPPHHTVPACFIPAITDAVHAGFVPIITHPERLAWLDAAHYPWLRQAAQAGAWLQVTAGALLGQFGPRAQYWSECLAGDGLIHVLASDAHDPVRRRPALQAAHHRATALLGAAEATHLVSTRPAGVLANCPPHQLPPLPARNAPAPARPRRGGASGGLRARLARWRLAPGA